MERNERVEAAVQELLDAFYNQDSITSAELYTTKVIDVTEDLSFEEAFQVYVLVRKEIDGDRFFIQDSVDGDISQI